LARIYHDDTVIKVLLICRDGNGSANWVDVPDQYTSPANNLHM
jgi:hypothetical protein